MKTLFIQNWKWLYLKKNRESRGASVFLWFLAGAQTLLGALSTSELPDGHRAVSAGCWPELAGLWHIQMGEQTGWLPSWVSDVLWLYFNE